MPKKIVSQKVKEWKVINTMPGDMPKEQVIKEERECSQTPWLGQSLQIRKMKRIQ